MTNVNVVSEQVLTYAAGQIRTCATGSWALGTCYTFTLPAGEGWNHNMTWCVCACVCVHLSGMAL
jgi:hypothetical protein